MRKKCKCLCSKLLLCPLAIGVLGTAHADGYRNPPPTAEGIAKAGVNSVFVDDASAISYNPANLGMQTDKSLVVAATFARSANTYTPAPGFSFESDDPWQVLPNLYYSQPVGEEGLVVGLGVSTPYGQGIEWNASDFAMLLPPFDPTDPALFPYEASITFVNFNPTVATKIYDGLYLGLGLDLAYSQLELKAVGNVPPAPSYLEGEGDGWGIGGNIGLTWIPVEQHRLALTYRSRMDIKYKGDTKFNNVGVGDFETTVKYPNTVGVGYGFQVSDDIQIEALFEWLQWSVNDTQDLDIGALGTVQSVNQWDDTFTIGVGGSWNITEALVARAGYSFIPSPIPDDTITPLLPDMDRQVIGLGLGYTVGAHTLDLSYAFSIYDDRDSTPSGAYEVDSNLAGVTYSLSF